MKSLKLFIAIMLVGMSVTSCVVENDYDDETPTISLEEIMTRHEIWYVDYNNTVGYGNVPFVSRAFTLSFINGKMYANNNIVGIGDSGNGFGIRTGRYTTHSGLLEIDHDIDGNYSFEVLVDTPSQIRLYNAYKDVTYYLEGYSRDSFDYDKVFYDNIEYFLQEYVAWQKTATSDTGEVNDFDAENYLAFTPENNTTFYSSQNDEGISVDDLYWDFTGGYEIFDVNGHEDMKVLTLDYDTGYNEEFEMTITNDETVVLYHYNSGTTYQFEGAGFIPYKNTTQSRARTKVKRKTINRKTHKAVTKRK